jgi:SAM-dependent methyltransferase
MRKQDSGALSLLLSGLAGRYRANSDYFIGVDFTFTIGRRDFPGRLRSGEDGLTMTYQAAKHTMDFYAFLDFFKSEAPGSERAVLIYKERGAQLTLEADERGVRSRQSDTPEGTGTAKTSAVLPDRDYIIKPSQAGELLQAIGVMAPDGKIRNTMIRKYNQIDHFLELVRPLIEQDDSELFEVLDCGCGKSYLSFVLNYFIRDILKRRCHITGVDIAPQVIEASRATAQSLGYHNMDFVCADLRSYTAASPSMVISLHACDTATDMAIGLAVRSGAKNIACVPCCHHELLNQYTFPGLGAITRHGVYAARFNDLLTDGLRTLKLESLGYKTRVIEYISPLDSPKNLLILAQKTAQGNLIAQREYDKLLRELKIFPAIERECNTISGEI